MKRWTGSIKQEPEREIKKKRQRKKYGGLLIHDLRRCAARNLARAGVSEQIAMKITGHKTPSMYRRYRIIDENEFGKHRKKCSDT